MTSQALDLLNTAVRCPKCGGWDPECSLCGGEGLLEAPVKMLPCPECDGSGRTDNHVTGEVECGFCGGSGEVFEAEASPAPIVFHPHPVPCRGCGTILQATYAQANHFCCPTCGRPVCYICGCSEDRACTSTVTTADGARSQTSACSWVDDLPGTCSFCASRAAYEMYQAATGRPATDSYYLNLGRTAFGVKGLGYGV